MKFRVISLLAFPLVVSQAFSQTRAVPHVIYADGSIFDVVYDVSGLQPVAKKWWDTYVVKHDGPKITASQNSQSLRMAASEIDGTPKTPTKWSIHRCLPNGPGLGGGQVSCVVQGVSALTLPALDVAATQTALFGIDFICTDASFDGFYTTTAGEKDVVKTQKKWLPANFRLKIGDLPCDRVSRIEQIRIDRAVADFDGDGKLDFGIRQDIQITLPAEDAAKFQEWFDATVPGSQVTKLLTLEYQDEDKVGFLTLELPVLIDSLGFSDPFQGTTSTPGRDATLTLRGRGIISVKSATI